LEAKHQTDTKLETLALGQDSMTEVVSQLSQTTIAEHTSTKTVISAQIESSESNSDQRHEDASAHADAIHVDLSSRVDTASELNQAEHQATRLEMERIRKEAEVQVEQLREEIRLLKLDLAESVKTVVACVGQVSAKQQKKLQESSNAKFNLWVAKEIILKKLLVSVDTTEIYRKTNLSFICRTLLLCLTSILPRNGHPQLISSHGRLNLIQRLKRKMTLSRKSNETRAQKCLFSVTYHQHTNTCLYIILLLLGIYQ
jgi:hypothetical protein